MPKVDYTTTIEVQRSTVWEFVRDMNNWAPFAKGYQAHEVVNDRESLWTVKGDIGPISRVTKFHVQITEWIEGEGVGFVLKGINESISGEGTIRLADASAGTQIRGEALLEFGGTLGPVINNLFLPWVKSGADELVTKIAVALQPTYVKPKRPFFLIAWLQRLWRFLRGQKAEPAIEVKARPAEPAVQQQPPPKGGTTMRVETLLLTPGVAGGPAGYPELQAIAESARRIERLGFDGTTTPEAGHDPFLPLMIAAEHTQRITLGTNVAIAFPRSPFVVAQIAWDLQRLSGGRFKLGLGTQVKGHNVRRYSTPWPGPPGPRLREYVQCLKAIFETFQQGTKPAYQGEHYQFTLVSPFFNPGPIEHPHVPIYVSALNTYMARLAGEQCDGVLLHPLGSHKYTKDVVLPAIRAGARKAGRPDSEIDVVASPFVVTGKDEAALQAALGPVRQQIAFYSSTRTYHSVLNYHGWDEIGEQLHVLSLEGKWVEMAKLISDDMLHEIATIGTHDEIGAKIKERWGGVCNTLFLATSSAVWRDDDQLQEFVKSLRA
jgi:probable F420-dependent oxidoreductase